MGDVNGAITHRLENLIRMTVPRAFPQGHRLNVPASGGIERRRIERVSRGGPARLVRKWFRYLAISSIVIRSSITVSRKTVTKDWLNSSCLLERQSFLVLFTGLRP